MGVSNQLNKGASRRLKVFLSYLPNDEAPVRDLFWFLRDDGYDPWMDQEKILPGQDPELETFKALKESDVILVCISPSSITSPGSLHTNIKRGLNIYSEQPEGNIFLIPVLLKELDTTRLPSGLSNLQLVKYYEKSGYGRLLQALNKRTAELGLETPEAANSKPSFFGVNLPKPFYQLLTTYRNFLIALVVLIVVISLTAILITTASPKPGSPSTTIAAIVNTQPPLSTQIPAATPVLAVTTPIPTTAAPVPSNTATIVSQPTATPTNTALPPTATATSQPTATLIPPTNTPLVPTATLAPVPIVPTNTPVPVPINLCSKLPCRWEGSYSAYTATSGAVIVIDKMDGTNFSGSINWKDFNNIVATFSGEIVQDFGDFAQQSKWHYIDKFDTDKSGIWLTFQIGRVIQGYYVPITEKDVINYAHIRKDGTLIGAWFLNANASTPGGMFSLSSVQTTAPAPTAASVVNLCSKLPCRWEGSYSAYTATSGAVIVIDKMDGTNFSGSINWKDFNNTVATFSGEIVQDFGDFAQQSKWHYIDKFDTDKSGIWLTFQIGRVIQGYYVPITEKDVINYAHIRKDGTLIGAWFLNANASTPGGMFSLSVITTQP